jgi:hypothetical protein
LIPSSEKFQRASLTAVETIFEIFDDLLFSFLFKDVPKGLTYSS